MKRALRAIVAVAILLVANPVLARPELGLDLGSSGMRLATSGGTRLAGNTGYGGLSLRAHAEVAQNISVGLEWWHAGNDAYRSGIDTSLSTEAGLVDARYHWRPMGWLEPHLRVGLGFAYHTLSISDSGGILQGNAWSPLAAATAGVDLILPRQWFADSPSRAHFSMGISIDFGWQHVLGTDWTVDSARSLSPAISQASVALGSAALTGTLTRAAFIVRF